MTLEWDPASGQSYTEWTKAQAKDRARRRCPGSRRFPGPDTATGVTCSVCGGSYPMTSGVVRAHRAKVR